MIEHGGRDRAGSDPSFAFGPIVQLPWRRLPIVQMHVAVAIATLTLDPPGARADRPPHSWVLPACSP